MKISNVYRIIILMLIDGYLNPIDTFRYRYSQLHLSFGTDSTEMIVTWTNPSDEAANNAFVLYGNSPNSFTHKAKAEVENFEKGGSSFTTYRALLTKLKPGAIYYYKAMEDDDQSETFRFRNIPWDPNYMPKFAIYGDLGYVNDESFPFLREDVDNDLYDAIFHVGDFAYDLHDGHGKTGHKFMSTIETLAARTPYMTCPGNHEHHRNFSHYDARFSMLGDRNQPDHDAPLSKRINNHFYSIDIGPAHIVQFSTEYYYYTEYGWKQIERQYRWLEEDLRKANENRQKRPWIIVMGHRPLYCLKIGDRSCDTETMERSDIRQGINMYDDLDNEIQYGLEELFYKYRVDLQFYGHEHFYARLLPIYNYEIKSGDNPENPYDHPKGPIHITTGSAGNKERHPSFNTLEDWVAEHFYDYGYTRLTFKDKYHIELEQISDDQNGKVADKISIIKSEQHLTY